MAEPALRHRWLAWFTEAPAAALDALLRGAADVAPYERADPDDLLVLFLGGPEHRLRALLDEAMTEWITARYRDNAATRREHGVSRYVGELHYALSAVMRLTLPKTIRHLQQQLDPYLHWLESLYLAPSRDPGGQLWTVVALHQSNRALLPEWYRLCAQAVAAWPDHYPSIGLLGLRKLPREDGSAAGGPTEELLAGVMMWGARLDDTKHDRQTFFRQWHALEALYPRAPHFWRERMLPLTERYEERPFVGWLRESHVLPAERSRDLKLAVQPASKERRLALLAKLQQAKDVEPLIPEIRSLIAAHERYAEATGDAEHVVRSSCHFATRLLERDAPSAALDLARIANRWQPSNPRTWTLWAQALAKLGAGALAEVVSWESVRRFPDHAAGWTWLAELLEAHGRHDEAERLYRWAVDRFPDDPVCYSGLGKILERIGRTSDAERLYRAACDRFTDDHYAWTQLGALLERADRLDDAESIYRKAMERFHDRMIPLRLGRVLVAQGKLDEAKAVLAGMVARVGDDARTAALDRSIREARQGQPQRQPPPLVDGTVLSDAAQVTDLAAALLRDNGLVQRADFDYSTGSVERKRSADDLEEVLGRRPGHVHASLVRALHDAGHRRALIADAATLPHALALRVLAAREARDSRAFTELRRDFPRHQPLLLLVRALDLADSDALERLRAWTGDPAADEPLFAVSLRGRLKATLFAEDGPVELAAVEAHRAALEETVAAVLKIVSDEEPPIQHAA